MGTNLAVQVLQAQAKLAADDCIVVSTTPCPADGGAAARLLALARASRHDASTALGRWLDEHVGLRTAGDPPPPVAVWDAAIPGTPETVQGMPAGERWIAFDPRAVMALRRLAAALPRAHFVVFVESPQAGLSAWIEDFESTPALVERRLDAWRRAARALLDNLPQLRGRLCLVALEDALDASSAAELCARHLGLVVPEGTSPVGSAATPRDPLAEAFARGLIAGDEAALLYAQLLAACDNVNPAPPRPAPGGAGQEHALALLRDACEARRELARDPGLLAAVRRSLGQADSAESERSDSSVLLQAVRQLQHARDGLARMGELLRDNDLLNTFLQQMQEELEFRRHAPRPEPIAPCPATFASEQVDPPHRHVEFTARCTIDDGTVVDIAGRLVEHHGRPGLLVFSDGGHAFSRWVESGDEGGRGFMLVVPQDSACAPLIDDAPASDWALMLRLAKGLQVALAHDVPMVQAQFWHGVASRLVSQLVSWPARIRWNTSTASVGDEGGQRSLQLDISGLSFDDRPPRPVRLRWLQPATGQAKVELLLVPTEKRPWLASWPIGPGGTAQPAWTLPTGRAWRLGARRDVWYQVSPDERRLLRSLLESLPRILSQTRTADGSAVEVSPAQSRTLNRIAADARRAMSTGALRAWARRWIAAWRHR